MIRHRLEKFKHRLFRIHEQEPLSKLSLCVIIALDLFILFVVFSGLEEHTRQLTAPDDYVPYECREIFISHHWTEANRISKLQQMVLSDYHRYSYRYDSAFDPARIRKMHPLCREFFLKVQAIVSDSTLFELFKRREQLKNAKKEFTQGFKQTKDVYDTSLLENIAENSKDDNQLSSISSAMKTAGQQVERLNSEILGIEKQLNESDKIKGLWDFIESGAGNQRDGLVKDLRRMEFWYPFKELCWQMIFLLPLFFVFYFWNVKSAAREAGLQTLISAHLLVIAAIPILFKITEVVLDLIPKHFFKEFFNLLVDLHIIAVWHYLVIMVSVGAALLAIYIIQKKFFTRRRLGLKRLAKGLCYHCGKKLPPGAEVCPFCGSDQHKNCPSCNHRTYAAGDFCSHCGKKLE